MIRRKQAVLAVCSTILGYLAFYSLYAYLSPHNAHIGDEDVEQARWIATSHSWIDRQACKWFGVCGVAHWRSRMYIGDHSQRQEQNALLESELVSAWTEGKNRPEDWTKDERIMREVPQYVLDYAPLVHLYSGERFWPCDIAEHLFHVTPYLNYTALQARTQNANLTNLDQLNQWNRGRFVYLTSDDNVEELPDWLEGEKNIPDTSDKPIDEGEEAGVAWDGSVIGELLDDTAIREGWYEAGEGGTHGQGGDRHDSASEKLGVPMDTVEGEELLDDLHARAEKSHVGSQVRGGRSDAPAVLIVVDKGNGIVDAFWFYFYSFNLGNVVLNVRFGNHVGDWEHSMVRFQHGKPKAVYFSEHNFGEAYSYEAVEKIGKRVSD